MCKGANGKKAYVRRNQRVCQKAYAIVTNGFENKSYNGDFNKS